MQSSRPVTVSLITTTYPRAEDDLEQPRFVADLVEHMAALDDRFEFTVLAPHAEGLRKNDCINGIKIRRFQYSLNARRQCLAYGHGIPDNLRHSLRARLQLPGFCLRLAQEVMALTSDCDLLHVNWIEPGVIAGFANFFAGKPLVLAPVFTSSLSATRPTSTRASASVHKHESDEG